ncbi:MAG: hypothetical protein PUI21_05980 [Collinsella sp.]|nr:hypothetical protein [Collinsella sp.]
MAIKDYKRERDTFDFTYGGKRYSLPAVSALSLGDVMAIEEASGDAGKLMAYRGIFERYAPGLFDQLTQDELLSIAADWASESGVSVGESHTSHD